MPRFVVQCLSWSFAALAALPLLNGRMASAMPQEEQYAIPPEAQKQEGVPEGKIEGPFDLKSEIFPGTQRQYWVYVPVAYDPEKPACTFIVQDGLNRAKGWKLPQIFDNLIHSQEMPVTIGIFVTPGVVPPSGEQSQPRFNRSFEYDSLGDRYARFLLQELIPEVSKTYNLSTDPNDRALAGASSGGICAFNAAWERPDAFRRVVSTIGTFVGLRGANQFPTLIRKVEPKPIRVFLQDGSSDLNIYAGDWWVANQDMLSALQWAGYDVKHVWGQGGHNGKHGAAIMPDALRWLWRDYPDPIQARASNEQRRVNLLIEDAGWEQVSSGHESAEAPVCNGAGELFFSDSRAGRIYRVGEDSKTRIFADQTGRISSLSFGPGDTLYAIRDGKQIVRFGTDGKQTVVLETPADSVVAMPNGFYYSDPTTPAIHWRPLEGDAKVALQLQRPISAFAPTADQAFMHLLSSTDQFTLHCKINPNGVLEHRQEYGYLHLPYDSRISGARGIAVDEEGRVYVASRIGVQVLDQLGRVNFILSPPSTAPLNGLSFGGAARDTLYVTAGGSVYRRKLATKGVATFGAPVSPPRPRL